MPEAHYREVVSPVCGMHIDHRHPKRNCRIPQDQLPNARHRHYRLDGPLERRFATTVGSRARAVETHRRSERPEGSRGRREPLDGGDLSGDHREPGLAERREQRAHRVQLLGGQRSGTALHAPHIAQSLLGRARGEPHAAACG